MAELTPIYELRLGEGDISEPSVSVIEGSSLEIRCTLSSNNEIPEKPIMMMKKGQLIEAERSTMSATVKIPSFTYKYDGGMYECSTVFGEKRVRRRLKVTHKAILPPHMTPCTEQDFCKNGGKCGKLDDTTNICICAGDYVGPTCEDVLVRDFIGKSILTRTKVGVAAGGTCNVVFIFFLVVLGLLFFRERKRRRRVEAVVHELSSRYNFESLPLVKDDLYAEDVYSQDVIVPPEKRSDAQSPVSNGKMMVRANAVKKIIAPGEEDDSVQPHSS